MSTKEIKGRYYINTINKTERKKQFFPIQTTPTKFVKTNSKSQNNSGSKNKLTIDVDSYNVNIEKRPHLIGRFFFAKPKTVKYDAFALIKSPKNEKEKEINALIKLHKDKKPKKYVDKIIHLLHRKSDDNYLFKRKNIEKAIYSFDKEKLEFYMTIPKFYETTIINQHNQNQDSCKQLPFMQSLKTFEKETIDFNDSQHFQTFSPKNERILFRRDFNNKNVYNSNSQKLIRNIKKTFGNKFKSNAVNYFKMFKKESYPKMNITNNVFNKQKKKDDSLSRYCMFNKGFYKSISPEHKENEKKLMELKILEVKKNKQKKVNFHKGQTFYDKLFNNMKDKIQNGTLVSERKQIIDGSHDI